jgi:hypothetical protein
MAFGGGFQWADGKEISFLIFLLIVFELRVFVATFYSRTASQLEKYV